MMGVCGTLEVHQIDNVYVFFCIFKYVACFYVRMCLPFDCWEANIIILVVK